MEKIEEECEFVEFRGNLSAGHQEKGFGVRQRIAFKKPEDSDRKM